MYIYIYFDEVYIHVYICVIVWYVYIYIHVCICIYIEEYPHICVRRLCMYTYIYAIAAEDAKKMN
jgi:hypothetical protein